MPGWGCPPFSHTHIHSDFISVPGPSRCWDWPGGSHGWAFPPDFSVVGRAGRRAHVMGARDPASSSRHPEYLQRRFGWAFVRLGLPAKEGWREKTKKRKRQYGSAIFHLYWKPAPFSSLHFDWIRSRPTLQCAVRVVYLILTTPFLNHREASLQDELAPTTKQITFCMISFHLISWSRNQQNLYFSPPGSKDRCIAI